MQNRLALWHAVVQMGIFAWYFTYLQEHNFVVERHDYDKWWKWPRVQSIQSSWASLIISAYVAIPWSNNEIDYDTAHIQ